MALAGLWISYLQIVAAIVTVGIILAISISAQNAYKSSVSFGDNSSTGTQTYGYVPSAAAADPGVAAVTDPAYSQPTAAPVVTGPAGVPQPAASVPVSDADKAYCQNRGVLLWLTETATFRGALCSIDSATTLVGISTEVGGSVVLAATAEPDSYTATAHDGKSVGTILANTQGMAAATAQLGHSSEKITSKHYVQKTHQAPDNT